MVKRSRTRRPPLSSEIALQITPMASIFTVILVFLLRSVSLSVSPVTASQELTLPETTTAPDLTEGLKVEITDKAVVVEGQAVVSLEKFAFKSESLAEDGSFKDLNAALSKESVNRQIASEKEASAVVFADVKTPYSVIKRVFASASNYGYTDLKLVVVGSE